MKKTTKKPTLEDLKNAGAYVDEYRWYKKNNGDVEKLASEHPDWYLWLVYQCPGDWIDPWLLENCAEKMPWAVQDYDFAAGLLTPEQLYDRVEKEPL